MRGRNGVRREEASGAGRRAGRGTALGVSCLLLAAGLMAQVQASPSPSGGPGQVQIGPEELQPVPIPIPPKATKLLPNPPAAQIPGIIRQFIANETMDRQLLEHSYVYTESIDMQLVDDDGNPIGQSYQQTNQIMFTPNGQREIVCTWCPQSTLQDVQITEDDINDFFNMEMYAVPVHSVGEYNIDYIDHEQLEDLTAYRFSVRPKAILPGHRYFAGTVWVDDHYLQIVKSEGKAVPDQMDKHHHYTNIFLPFTTYRQLIDGQHWFPVYTSTNSHVGDARVKTVIQFKDYKRFGSSVTIQYQPLKKP